MSESCWSVYIIRCGDGSLYTGIATDVERRFGEHVSQGRRLRNICADGCLGSQVFAPPLELDARL